MQMLFLVRFGYRHWNQRHNAALGLLNKSSFGPWSNLCLRPWYRVWLAGSCHGYHHVGAKIAWQNWYWWFTVSGIYNLRPMPRCINTAPLPNALSWACWASTTKHIECGIVKQHDGQTLWQNKNARLPCIPALVLFTLLRRAKSPSVPLRFRQEDVSPNLVERSLSPWLQGCGCYANNCSSSHRFTNFLNRCGLLRLHETSSMATCAR